MNEPFYRAEVKVRIGSFGMELIGPGYSSKVNGCLLLTGKNNPVSNFSLYSVALITKNLSSGFSRSHETCASKRRRGRQTPNLCYTAVPHYLGPPYR